MTKTQAEGVQSGRKKINKYMKCDKTDFTNIHQKEKGFGHLLSKCKMPSLFKYLRQKDNKKKTFFFFRQVSFYQKIGIFFFFF